MKMQKSDVFIDKGESLRNNISTQKATRDRFIEKMNKFLSNDNFQ